MDDEEFRSIVINTIKALLLTLIICLPIIIFYFNKYKLDNNTLNDAFSKKQTFILYIYEEKVDDNIINRLDDTGVKYYKYDINKERNTESLLMRFGLSDEDIDSWLLIYVKDGVMSTNTNDIDDLDGFLNNLD